jgi:sulfane dehydrogenase subunit SoxC
MDSKRPDRREFLKSGAALAGGLSLGAAGAASAETPATEAAAEAAAQATPEELVAYGERSRFVTSVRMPVNGRPSPDEFGLDFHIGTPLQDSVGVITPSSLHYVGTTRGSFVPDIDPAEHRLMIHGMVDRELIFTMDELKRFPSVTRLHFLECAGNRSNPRLRTIQESHGMTSCAEWTGVLLSVLLNEAGVQDGGNWIVAEGVEEVKGASSIPMTKAMEDCIVCYAMNGEPVRPQQGFPLRLMVPGF